MLVENILSGKGDDVIAVVQSDLISEAVHILKQKNIGALVVLDDQGKLVGILSERDIVRALDGDPDGLMSKAVSSLMTKDPFTATPATSVDEAMNLMTQKRIRHLPIEKNGQLHGMISIGDVVKRKIEQAEIESEALKEYIAAG